MNTSHWMLIALALVAAGCGASKAVPPAAIHADSEGSSDPVATDPVKLPADGSAELITVVRMRIREKIEARVPGAEVIEIDGASAPHVPGGLERRSVRVLDASGATRSAMLRDFVDVYAIVRADVEQSDSTAKRKRVTIAVEDTDSYVNGKAPLCVLDSGPSDVDSLPERPAIVRWRDQ